MRTFDGSYCKNCDWSKLDDDSEGKDALNELMTESQYEARGTMPLGS
jgi:hypothetical protein